MSVIGLYALFLLMSVSSLYTLLPKNSGFVAHKFFSQYFPIFEHLHIERFLLVINGQLIKGSGLIHIFFWKQMIGLSQSVKPICYHVIGLHTNKSKNNTSFLYWKCAIALQIKVLLYVRSIFESNFKLQATCWSIVQIIKLVFYIWSL